MRALCLGSGGRVGRLLRAAWPSDDIDVTWHTRKMFDIFEGDLESSFADYDAIVNLAGATHHRATNINNANTKLALRVLNHAGDKPVFLLSSAAIYGVPTGPLSEDATPVPVSDYGRDKAGMEAAALAHPTTSIILRLGNVAGADALLGVNRERYVLDIFPDGTHPSRSYIGPNLLANTIAKLIKQHHALPPILNVSTPSAVSMGALLQAASKPWNDKPAGFDAIAKVEMCTDLLEQFVDLPASTAASIVEDWQSVRPLT